MNCKQLTVKTLSIIATVAILLSSLLVPMVSNVSAAKQSGTVVYDFDPETTDFSYPSSVPDYNPDEVCGGWSFKVRTDKFSAPTYGFDDTFEGSVLSAENPGWKRTWVTSGGFRFNKNGVGYTLSAGHTYKVTFKMKVTSAINNGGGNTISTSATARYDLGYGIKLKDEAGEGTHTVYISGIDKVLYNICSYGFESTEYSYDTMEGVKTAKIASDADWNEVTYVFTAPADAEGQDLGLFGGNYTGGTFYMDDFAVTDLGENVGAVYATNVLTDEVYVYAGEVGTSYSPENCEKIGKRNFTGWYSDANGTNKIESFTFAEGINFMYGCYDGATEITCIIPGEENRVITGQRGEAIVLPTVDEFKGAKKFIGWYTDAGCTSKFTDTQFGVKDISLYAYYSAEVTVTLTDTRNKKSGKNTTYDIVGYPEDDITSKLVYPIDKAAKTEAAKQAFAAWCTDDKATAPYKSDVFPHANTTLYSQWIKTPDSVITDFESYDFKDYNSKVDYGTNTRIADGEGISGSKAAAFNFVEGRENRCYVKMATIDQAKQTGRLFKLSYSYRVASADAPVTIKLTYASSPNNYWENTSSDADRTITAITDGQWHTVEYGYYIPNTYVVSGVERLIKGIYVGAATDGNADIYIDDCKMEAYQVANTYIGFYAMNDDEYDTLGAYYEDYNTYGEAIKFPEGLTSGDRAFIGWATDKEGKNMFTDTTHRDKNVILYAIWDKSKDPIMQKFENYPTNKNRLAFNNTLLQVCEEAKKAGNYGLKFAYNQGVAAAGVAASSINNCVSVLTVEDDTPYKVTFSYNAVKSGTNVSVKLATSTGGNIWDPAHNVNYPGSITIPAGESAGWQTATLYLKTNFTKGQAYTGDTLYLIFSMASSDDTVIYFDNIAALKLDDDVYNNLSKIYFDDQNGGGGMDVANPGDTIKFPVTPTTFGKVFSYWATDKEGTEPFTATTHQGGETTLYAIFDIADEVYFDFENYTYSSQFDVCDSKMVDGEIAYSGTKAFKVDRDNTGGCTTTKTEGGKLNSSGAFFPLATNKVFVLDANYNYYFTFKYYIARKATGNARFKVRIADTTNLWHQGTEEDIGTSKAFTIGTDEEVGVWHDGIYAMTFDFSENKNAVDHRAIYMRLEGGTMGIFYFDDFVIHKVPKDQAIVAFKRNGATSLPDHILVAPGSDYSSKIPMKPTRKGYLFSGYYLANAKLTEFMAPDYGTNIIVRWVESAVDQNFDGAYKEQFDFRVDYSVADFDYELYDSQAEGHSKDNVTSGRYSLHRKGESMYFENACLLNSGALSDTERYTVTFKVKMDKSLQQDGAVKLASCKSSRNPWDTIGSYYAVIPVADLVDGEWHEVSYTFNSVDAYAAIQTPGYCSIYIDDVHFDVAEEGTPLSTECTYTEYIVQKRDADGKVITKLDKASAIDISKIIDDSLVSIGGDKGVNVWLIVIIAAAAVVVAGGAVAAVLIIKKKKANKAA